MGFGLVAVEAHEVTFVDGLGARVLALVVDEGDAVGETNAVGRRSFDDAIVDEKEPVLQAEGQIQEVPGNECDWTNVVGSRVETRT